MPAAAPGETNVQGTCCHCARPTYGRRVRYGVGWRRGVEARALDTDLRVLAVDEVVVCEACERKLVRAGVVRSPELTAAIASVFAISLSTSAGPQEWITYGGAVLAVFGVWTLARWRRQRPILLREMLFEARRSEYARRLDRPAGSLAAYPEPTSS